MYFHFEPYLRECNIGEVIKGELMLFPTEPQLLTPHNPGGCNCRNTHTVANEKYNVFGRRCQPIVGFVANVLHEHRLRRLIPMGTVYKSTS